MTFSTVHTTTTEKLEQLKIAHTPTPLWVLLYIYSKARKECYVMYLDGAEAVFNWLTNDRKVPLEIPPIPEDYRLPDLLGCNYEARELAKIIVGSVIDTDDFDKWLTDVAKMDWAIQHVMQDKVRNLL